MRSLHLEPTTGIENDLHHDDDVWPLPMSVRSIADRRSFAAFAEVIAIHSFRCRGITDRRVHEGIAHRPFIKNRRPFVAALRREGSPFFWSQKDAVFVTHLAEGNADRSPPHPTPRSQKVRRE